MKKAVVFSIQEDTEEIRALLQTLGIEIVEEFVQKRDSPHRTGFVGPGKIEEIHKRMEDVDVDLIVVNGLLKPSQHHFLEMDFQKEVVDRTGVILRIFADHAHTPEAIAQVTLAKLRYEVPFLREWIHKAKSGDRPGFLAGGAYATDVYFEHAKTHARRIEKNLKELSKQRETTRTRRRSKGYTLVSLAGYTNAGKSALMNRMCNASMEVDDRLFSTLSTTTRRIAGIKANVLMSDTVGFIKDLPPDLIDAFNSTLEEIFYADLILLIVDVSETDEQIEMKLKTSIKILLPKIEDRALVVVGNKVDMLSGGRREESFELVERLASPHEAIFVSAVTGDGLDELKQRIIRIQGFNCTIEARLPLADESYSLLSRIRSSAEVSMKVMHDSLEVVIKCRPEDVDKLTGRLAGAHAISVARSCAEAVSEGSEKARSSNGSEGAPLF